MMRITKKTIRKEIRFWIIILLVFGFLYTTGYHTIVIGKVQSLLLYTNILTPQLENNSDQYDKFDYQGILVDSKGETLEASQLKGKTIFINFWASWCPPCIAELPTLQTLIEETKAQQQDIAFLLINVDDSQVKADKILSKIGLDITYYRQLSSLNLSYSALPTTFIMNKTGDIVVKQEGMANFNSDKFKAFLTNL